MDIEGTGGGLQNSSAGAAWIGDAGWRPATLCMHGRSLVDSRIWYRGSTELVHGVGTSIPSTRYWPGRQGGRSVVVSSGV